LPDIIRVFQREDGQGYIGNMEEKQNTYKTSVGKHDRNRKISHGRCRDGLEDGVAAKLFLSEIIFEESLFLLLYCNGLPV
jgi:hypothetical protein